MSNRYTERSSDTYVPADPHPRLYNYDLAPVPGRARHWTWAALFNTWANGAQSLLGYTLAASLFFNYGLNGWWVFTAIVLSGFIAAFLMNLIGAPSVRYGIPFPVFARASMGVYGANVPAMMRGVVAIFWYGAQSYVGSTAILLLITGLFGPGPQATFLGVTAFGWVALVIVSVVQVMLFWKGMEWIRRFLNLAGPIVYLVMLVLLVSLWVAAGPGFTDHIGRAFEGRGSHPNGPVAAFVTVMGIMIAFYAPIILNFGDFSRFVKSERQMRLGNLIGLPFNMALFAAMSLCITAGTTAVFGEHLTNPVQVVQRVDNTLLTVVAGLTFFVATAGINVIANYVPPANDLSNLWPGRISFRTGGLIAACAAFVVSAFWVSFISEFGISRFVNTLGAFLAPAYGIIVADYYVVKRRKVLVEELYSAARNGLYAYSGGYNGRALIALAIGACFSILSVWWPALESLSGFGWILGAVLGGLVYWLLVRLGTRSDRRAI
ncbi:NCS1 family nucleobase:cation symporter-1 [Roseibium sp. RKSG952]|uniref:NCS1 family nucleobase:cation symporter-1 n=1 Tax=Roseibium sp. RKSG952 TaxID=2529384 RepID=UPI0012BB8C44|nr:NCS1 family nucleobase:cation symporter-1 [Roseibium sp. RKSG952]MTI00356.1 NCS1 family nucleobase:cation symporter-1 [Roseibium sp. RKSG952]